MNRRLTIATFATFVVVALAGLLAAAATDHRRTAFSLGVPNNEVVVALSPGHRLCQGPFTVDRRFSAFELWLQGRSRFHVDLVRAPSGARLFGLTTHGSGAVTGSTTVPVAGVDIRPGTRLSVCIRNLSLHPLRIEGGPANGSSGRARTAGIETPSGVALLFLRADSPTLLSLLPDVFRRASLFKLSFVGAWSFWTLLGAILVGLAVLGGALALAMREDDSSPGPEPPMMN